MSESILVLLAEGLGHLANKVLEAGCIPVIDATGAEVPIVPDGAWVRTRPGRPAPGNGPVILAELGAPVPDRETWLETTAPREVPAGFTGLILKGMEAGGLHGEEDGLAMLAQSLNPEMVILWSGVGPETATAAAALGAKGVLLAEQLLATPEVALLPSLRAKLELDDEECSIVVDGFRLANGPTAKVLTDLLDGSDPWELASGVYTTGDLNNKLWMAGQGLSLARELAERFGDLTGILNAYNARWAAWGANASSTVAVETTRTAASAKSLSHAGATATPDGIVGSSVLWQEAVWLDRSVAGAPIEAAIATGQPVAASSESIHKACQKLVENAEKKGISTTPLSPENQLDSVIDLPTKTAEAGPIPISEPRGGGAVAVIGLGCRFPGADSIEQYWQNLTEGICSITEVPKERWDPKLFHDPDPSTPDMTYSKIGGFLHDFKFTPKRFRIPPKVAQQVDPLQQMTLMSVADALEDADLKVDKRSGGREFDRSRCAVILGNSIGGEVKDTYAIRLQWPDVAERIRRTKAFGTLDPADQKIMMEQMAIEYKRGLPRVDEDSMPGELSNVVAGRVANTFDLAGANFTVDAACASSMAAIQTAVKGLQDGDFDLVVSGGADRSMNIPAFVKFSKIGALSPDHSSPFDETANGFVMGEGCGILILKRLEDAIRDNDKIYALVRGVGASSDGKGKGITAPNITGQIRALERAYELSGVDPKTVDLMECHGTSTTVGDTVEVTALSQFIGAGSRPANNPIRIGSVKSNFGHLKSAAGAASCIKASLALYHGVMPPSLGFHKAPPGLPLDSVPLKVQTKTEAWNTESGIRRCGISAFGFGGTNFHVVMESFAGQVLPRSQKNAPTPDQPLPILSAQPKALPSALWMISAQNPADLLDVAKGALQDGSRTFSKTHEVRVAAAANSTQERDEQLERLIAVLEKGRNASRLKSRGIFYEDSRHEGKIAMIFTGQGSQYLDMGMDLAETYPIVADTFAEADRVIEPLLGRPITDFIKSDSPLGNDKAEREELLKQTQHSQPATLALDIALFRLMRSFGLEPDLVAGHSLGEYAANVAAGIMTFEQALIAVSARGKEMANIKLEDTGKMCGIAASAEKVQPILDEIDGYIVAANKNCPSQTVIAGASVSVEIATERFKEMGLSVYPLPVSHAFHSAIVAPAAEPLMRVLSRLGLTPPKMPITTNVDASYYPTGPDSVEKIIKLLGRQISSPVLWTDQIESAYNDGARLFIEMGPKRALSGFVLSILKRKEHRAISTNHPKRGGVNSFHDALASLIAAGIDLGPAQITAPLAPVAPAPTPPIDTAPDAKPAIAKFLESAAANQLSDSKQFAEAMLPAVQGLLDTAFSAAKAASPPPATATAASTTPASGSIALKSVVCSGASVGLPGGEEVFDPFNISKLLKGENRISHIGDRAQRFLEKSIVRLVKDEHGQGSFVAVEEISQVLRLAGTGHDVDLVEYGVSPDLSKAFDVCTKLAIAAGLEALKDAGLPLVRRYKISAAGKKVPQGFALPESLCDSTGVIFASAFPGYDQLINHVNKNGADEEDRFDRRFLFQILAMGHSQFAQFIGARGPNTSVNAACASTTQATAIAADWIKLGRCDRVVIVGADDVTSNNLLPWIGSGFLAAGAATTHDVVEEAALPFDRRRHGMILGMGAVGLVLESAEAAAIRGVTPIAQLLGSTIANSAFHGTRLDPPHIANSLSNLVKKVCAEHSLSASEIASNAMFMSHETYTPARGGSAAAEIEALRSAFGADANQITVANTKGFTGHAMGAGIEDTIAVKALQYGTIPPVANFKEPDEALGDLRISRGERRPVKYAIRLAAGFGSQLALTVWRGIAQGDNRIADMQVYTNALKQMTGLKNVQTEIVNRTLRALESQVDSITAIPGQPIDSTHLTSKAEPATTPTQKTPKSTPAKTSAQPKKKAPAQPGSTGQELADLTALIAEKTGYDTSELEPDFELEADLGIDTVKQAEIFSELRERYGLQPDESFRLADYPTIEALAGYMTAQRGSEPSPPTSAPTEVAEPDTTAAPSGQELTDLTALIAEKTGYEPEELEPDFELEADLGIDTVKQAEIFSELRERYGLQPDESFRLADYPTIETLAGYMASQRGGRVAVNTASAQESAPPAAVEPVPEAAPEPPETPEPAKVSAPEPTGQVLADLTALIAEKTGYEPEELEPDFELEADLGIDTVKQAEIFSELRERYGLQPDESFRLADYPTIETLAGYMAAQRNNPTPPSAGTQEIEIETTTSTQEESVSAPTPSDESLPATFRVRRPILVPQEANFSANLTGLSVRVLGEDALSQAVSSELSARGATAEAPFNAVVDLSRDVMSGFHAAKEMAATPPQVWLTITRLGGWAGGCELDIGHVDGARAGITKSLHREWSQTRAVALDVSPDLSHEEVSIIIAQELTVGSGSNEVFRSQEERRVVRYETVFEPETAALSHGSVVLLTGGGRGVTARIALEIAARGNVSLALVGRGPRATEALDEAKEKARIKADLAATGERVKPVQIERALNPLRKAAEIRQNILAMEAAGATVKYYQADLADPLAVKALVKTVTSDLGSITAVVHGAGVEVSKPLQEKSDDDFHMVFDGKAVGGSALMAAIDDSVKFISMGSVAGRFGNPGQVDYAAANNALATQCLNRPNSLAIDWTAWDDVGMAIRGGMRSLLEGRGVELLPANAGAALAVNLLAGDICGELVVSGSLGDFNPEPDHPLLDTVSYEADKIVAVRNFSLESDGWVNDHSIDGTPILPGVIGLELMAATAALVRPGCWLSGAHSVEFKKPVKAHSGRDIKLVIEASPGDDGSAVVTLCSERKLRTGKMQRVENFSATFSFDQVIGSVPLPSVLMQDEDIKSDEIYKRFFHGPIFQVLRHTESIATDALLANAVTRDSAIACPMVTAPLALEAAFQAAGLHRMIIEQMMGLPSRFDSLEFGHPCPESDALQVMVHMNDGHYDVDVSCAAGTVLMLRGFALIDVGPTPGGGAFDEPDDGRHPCFHITSDSDIATSGPRDVPSAWLSGAELAALNQRGSAQRVQDRIVGRIAAKRALFQHFGIHPNQASIVNNDLGAPVAKIDLDPSTNLNISISHRDGEAVAVVSANDRVGVDLELVQHRSSAFLQDWFTDNEQALFGQNELHITIAWCIKEATAKALGLGMALSMRDIEVVDIWGNGTSGTAAVQTHNQALETQKKLSNHLIRVRWTRSNGNKIIAIARLAA